MRFIWARAKPKLCPPPIGTLPGEDVNWRSSMALSLSPRALSRASARHPWKVVAVWAAIFVISIGLTSAFLSDALTTEADAPNSPDSKVGWALLEQRLRGPTPVNEAVVIRSETLTVDDPAFRAYVEGIHSQIGALGPQVTRQALVYYKDPIPGLAAAVTNVEDIIGIVEAANGKQSFEVYVSGNASVSRDFNVASEKDLARGETVGGLIALVILILVFGAVVAALVPVVLAVMAIVAAIGVTALVGQVSQLSFFVTNMITMMGLAVGIDYSLFVLSRFREEGARGRAVLDAVDIASATAGRAGFFRGGPGIIALAGVVIPPPPAPQAVQRLRRLLSNAPVCGPSTFSTNRAEDLGLLSVQIATDPYADAANDAIRRLRSEYVPQAFSGVDGMRALVTGLAAFNLAST